MNDDLSIIINWPTPDFPSGQQETAVYIPLRPFFAALAMNGILANPSVDFEPSDLADVAWRRADAMLKRWDEKPEADEVAE